MHAGCCVWCENWQKYSTHVYLHMKKIPAESKGGHLPKKWVKCQRAYKQVKVINQSVLCVVLIDGESNALSNDTKFMVTCWKMWTI